MPKFPVFFLVLLVGTPAALAQESPAGGTNPVTSLLMFIPLILIFYFLLIRPQQQRHKKHRTMVEGIKRADTVITVGGLIGKVTRVADSEITIEIAEGVRVRVVKGMVADVPKNNTPN